MVGWVILIVYLAGILPGFVFSARHVYDDLASTYRSHRDGEAMALASLIGIMGGGIWPLVLVGLLVYKCFQVGWFDLIFIRPEARKEILRQEREERIYHLERQIAMSPDQVYRRDEIERRLPAKYRRVQ